MLLVIVENKDRREGCVTDEIRPHETWEERAAPPPSCLRCAVAIGEGEGGRSSIVGVMLRTDKADGGVFVLALKLYVIKPSKI